MRFLCFTLLFSVLSLGCARVNVRGDVRPVYPKLTQFGRFSWDHVPTVDSLTPTFRWEGVNLNKGQTWDFAIWDAVRSIGTVVSQYSPGMQIYYRQGLKETSHKPEIQLLPLKKYFWSVKLSGAERWTTFDCVVGVKDVMGRSFEHYLFFFETPMKTGP